jgi:pimeloyl-ACP methyl ester carboxylesterase
MDSREFEPLSLAPAELAGLVDRRADFRALYCAGEDDAADRCKEALREFRSEGEPRRVPRADPALRSQYRIAVALGIGWDCVRGLIDEPRLPVNALRSEGFDTRLLEVEGLSSSERNADIVAAYLLDDLVDVRPYILVGYSKGATDMLVALARHPELASQTAAFVSIAGAIGGSPVAENDKGGTEKLLSWSPYGDCSTGDGGAMASLRPRTRHAWLRDNLPIAVPTFSVVTAPAPNRVSRALRSSYKALGIVHPFNDGALLHWDQLLPGSQLLGYANADHWAVTVPIDTSGIPFGSLAVSNDYDRLGLWRSVLDFVIAEVSAGP